MKPVYVLESVDGQRGTGEVAGMFTSLDAALDWLLSTNPPLGSEWWVSRGLLNDPDSLYLCMIMKVRTKVVEVRNLDKGICEFKKREEKACTK